MLRAELLCLRPRARGGGAARLGQLALPLEQHRQVVHGGERAPEVRAELPLVALERAEELVR